MVAIGDIMNMIFMLDSLRVLYFNSKLLIRGKAFQNNGISIMIEVEGQKRMK
jgi:hypothetical protein